MLEVLYVLLVFVLVALGAMILRAPEAYVADPGETRVADPDPVPGKEFIREHPLVPWIAGLLATFALLAAGGQALIAASAGAVVGVGVSILLRTLATRRMSRFEAQLAESIDLMVSTLRAGGGLTDALDGAAREIGRPLRDYLQELLDRIRLGERPEEVLTSLERRVPLESFRLFTLTLAAHWQGGGSLATTLSNVGRTIRDRVDVKRRVRSQAVETQVSVVAVLVITYGLAAMMWNNYPDRFLTFATSELGSMFIGLSIFLQAVGLFWISRISRIEV